jgi:hypothetical protein
MAGTNRAMGSTRKLAAGVAAALTIGAATLAAGVGLAASPDSSPAASLQYAKKVTVCHRTRSKRRPFVTLRVSRSALRGHLRHGDTVGSCSLRLNGTVSDSRIRLARTTKARVTKLRRGRYIFVISDQTRFGNFHLRGPRINRQTGIRFRGTARFRILLRKGRYVYFSNANSALRGGFRVR